MDSKQYVDAFLNSIIKDVEEYNRQWDEGLCKCDFKTWLRRREKGEYHFRKEE